MSRISLRQEGLVVIDEALAAATFKALAREVARGDYRSVHAHKWDKAWRLWDGHPMRGESVYFDPHGIFGWKGPTYPTSTSVDLLIDAVRRVSADCPDVAGAEGADWVALYLSPWLYPVGSALSLHQDGERYSGAFTLFTHTRWSVHWGGELHVSPEVSPFVTQTKGGTTRSKAHDTDEAWMSDDGREDDDPGIATSVLPTPNRLVLIGANRPHRVSRVDQNAGAHLRASIAGFFLRAP